MDQRIIAKFEGPLAQGTFNNSQLNPTFNHVPGEVFIKVNPALPTQRIGNAGYHME